MHKHTTAAQRDVVKKELQLNKYRWRAVKGSAATLARSLLEQGHPPLWSHYNEKQKQRLFENYHVNLQTAAGKDIPRCCFYWMVATALRSIRHYRPKANKKRCNTQDMNGAIPAVDGCTKSPNIPLSMMLTTEKHVSTIQSTHFQNTMSLSGSKSTMDSNRSGHKDIPIFTKKAALGSQTLPQWAEEIGKDFSFSDFEWKSLETVVQYHIHKMTEKSPELPWEEYSDEKREEYFEEVQIMFEEMTRKTITRAGLELVISGLVVSPPASRGPTPPNPLSAVQSTHFDGTEETKIDANSSHHHVANPPRRYDPIRDLYR